MANFSVFGSSGFIGRQLTHFLVREGHHVEAYTRTKWPAPGEELGNVIFTIGMTGSFREKPLETAESHVSVLATLIRDYEFASILYCSSTRVYLGSETATESQELHVNPNDPNYLYNITKLAGEALCLSLSSPKIRVVRLSNVVGPGAPRENFLPNLLHEAKRTGHVVLKSSFESSKDYIDIWSTCALLERIALEGGRRIYNVASGLATTNADIAGMFRQKLGVSVTVGADAPTITFPRIDITRIRNEFDFKPILFHDTFSRLLGSMGEIDDYNDQ